MGKIDHSNSNKQCCVPQCKSRCTNEISLFRFPKDETQRKKWTDAIKIEKGITLNMQVCSRHFVKNDYIISDIGGSKVKRLKRTAVPSQNLPWQFPNKRVSPTLAKARMERLKNRSQQKRSDSPIKSESDDQPDDVKKSEGIKKPKGIKLSEDSEKPGRDVKSDIISDSSSEKLEDVDPKNEDMSDGDDDKVTENKSVDVKDEQEDETEDNIKEAVEENGGEATEAKKDENNMSRAPTRLRQRKGLLKCEHCGRKCLTPQALQTHQQTAHKNARNNLINPKKEPTRPQSSPKPVALISVKSPESLQNFKVNPLEKSLNSNEVEKVLQEWDLGSDSDASVKEEMVERKCQRKTEFQCPLCNRRFAEFFIANRHIQKHHHMGRHNGNKPLLPKPARIDTCTVCNATLEGSPHGCAGPLKLASGYVCTGCEQEYKTLTLFDMHKSSRHNDGVESMFFPSLDEFEVWKQRMQSQTRSKFTVLDQSESKKIHRCIHRTRLRAAAAASASASAGSRQLMCPASVVVQEYSKGFQVHYYPHHYGHAYEKYNLGKAFKKYSISSLMNKTASKLPDSDEDTETDLYLQFQQITELLVNEAARVNVNGLKTLMRKALDMIAVVNSYVEDEDDDVITSSVIKLDQDKDDLQDQIKKALSSLKRPGERVEVAPVKRRKSVFQSTENTLKTKEVVRATPVKGEETENKFEKEPLKSNQSPSFIDSFQDFVGKALVKPVEKKKRPSEGKKSSSVKTKIGQFKPKSPPVKASLSPKSPPAKASLSPKSPLVKPLSPKSPKTNIVSSRKSGVKDIEYEVKEQENDCNILILKI